MFMDRFPRRGSDWIGLGAMALGAAVLAGYALHSPMLVQLRYGDDAMVVNTAISFIFAGLALLGLRWLGAAPVIALNGATLVENLTGRSLGVDWPQLHLWLHESDIHPGRVSPITCVGFLLFAATVLAVPHIHTRRGAHVARWLTGLVVLTAATGIVGTILRFDLLFGLYGMTRTALHSGIGMLALGLGLWLSWRNERWNGARRGTAHGRRILTAAAAALVIVVAAAGVGGFWLLERLAERDAEVQLTMRRQERVTSVRAVLQNAVQRGEMLVERLDLRNGGLSPATARDFSTVELRNQAGKVVNRIGQPPIEPGLAVALPPGTHASLVWNYGYYLRQRLPVPIPGGGTAILEQPLPLIASVGLSSPTWGKSGEVAICGSTPTPQQMACFPIRMHPQPLYLHFSMFGAPLPMSLALQGQSGVIEARDYRGQRVLAAYAPIPGTGLGLVAKIDTAEMYAPIRRQFEIMVPLLAVLTLAGLEILRWQMRPLVRELVESRNQAVVSEARFRAAAESGLDPFFIFESERDPASSRILDFRLVYANHAGERLAGLEASRSVHVGLAELHALAAPGGFLDKFSRVVANRQSLQVEFPLAPESAAAAQEETGPRWLHLQAAPLGDGVAVTLRDISQRKWEEERLIAMAQTDPLTGLANRSAFRKRLMHAMESSRRLRRQSLLALLYLDIDHFKEINDTLGHDQGDHLLEEFADRLRSCVRSVDTVGRPGGDEFTILLENLDGPDDAERVVLAIYRALRRSVRLDSQEMEIGTSIGLAFYRGEEISADELMRRADAAMYAAKREGRNRFRVFAA